MTSELPLMAAAEVLTFAELVDRAAIRALGRAAGGDVQVHLRVAVPQLHVGLGTRAEDAALAVEILGGEFHHRFLAHSRHVQTLVSQWAYLGLRPFTMSK